MTLAKESSTDGESGLWTARSPRRWAAIALAGATLVGCRGDRLLRIESMPPGATVRLDGEIVGRTPVSIPFEHYGRRRLALYRPGYRTHTEALKLDPRWWSRFPLDILTEIVIPLGIDDVRERKIALAPDTGERAAPATEEFIEHALLARSGDPLVDVPGAGLGAGSAAGSSAEPSQPADAETR